MFLSSLRDECSKISFDIKSLKKPLSLSQALAFEVVVVSGKNKKKLETEIFHASFNVQKIINI